MRTLLFLIPTLAFAGDSYELTRLPQAGGRVPQKVTLTVGQILQADANGNLVPVALSGGGDALTGNPLSQFAATTSAQLRGVISDESGTGPLFFQGGSIGSATGVALNLSGNATAAGFLGPLTGNVTGNVTGNASTATALQTSRTINGVSFDGTGNITVAAAAGTLTGTTLAANVVSSSLTSVGTLGSLNVAGTTTSGAFSGPLTGSVTGNASTATALQTPRTINGTLFDGTANINLVLALGTDTTGNYAAGDAEAGAALTGDSATSFFSTGTLEDARLSANVSLLGSDIDLGGSEATGTLAAGRFPALTGDVTTTAGSLATTIAANSVALGTDTTGNYAAGDAEAGAALTGDSATSFFSTGTLETARLNASLQTGQIIYSVGNGVDVITTGYKGSIPVHYSGTITGVEVVSVDSSTTSGTIVMDVWKDTYTNFPPANADSITASDKPTITAATKSQDTDVSTWTTSFSAGDYIGFEVESVSSFTKILIRITTTRQ